MRRGMFEGYVIVHICDEPFSSSSVPIMSEGSVLRKSDAPL